MHTPSRTKNGSFSLPIRIYNHDIDAGRVVFVANYLKFMERARTEWLHSIGVNQREMERVQRSVFVIKEAAMQFLGPAFLDDIVDSTVRINTLARSSLVLHQTVMRDGVVLCSADIQAVCINVVRFRPVRIPPQVRSRFELELQKTAITTAPERETPVQRERAAA